MTLCLQSLCILLPLHWLPKRLEFRDFEVSMQSLLPYNLVIQLHVWLPLLLYDGMGTHIGPPYASPVRPSLGLGITLPQSTWRRCPIACIERHLMIILYEKEEPHKVRWIKRYNFILTIFVMGILESAAHWLKWPYWWKVFWLVIQVGHVLSILIESSYLAPLHVCDEKLFFDRSCDHANRLCGCSNKLRGRFNNSLCFIYIQFYFGIHYFSLWMELDII